MEKTERLITKKDFEFLIQKCDKLIKKVNKHNQSTGTMFNVSNVPPITLKRFLEALRGGDDNVRALAKSLEYTLERLNSGGWF